MATRTKAAKSAPETDVDDFAEAHEAVSEAEAAEQERKANEAAEEAAEQERLAEEVRKAAEQKRLAEAEQQAEKATKEVAEMDIKLEQAQEPSTAETVKGKKVKADFDYKGPINQSQLLASHLAQRRKE